MKETSRKIGQLFFTMMKIGLFTFGGGYAMIALLENELVSRKKWVEKEEFLNMVAITSSAPGSIAVNASVYIGYKLAGAAGAAAAMIGVCLPSFVIIYLISLFFDAFLGLTIVQYAFRGIQVCVIYLILSAGLKMMKSMEKSVFSAAVLGITVLGMILFSMFSVRFSTVFYILSSGAAGVFLYLIRILRKKGGEKEA